LVNPKKIKNDKNIEKKMDEYAKKMKDYSRKLQEYNQKVIERFQNIIKNSDESQTKDLTRTTKFTTYKDNSQEVKNK
jgi:hypothetical protein